MQEILENNLKSVEQRILDSCGTLGRDRDAVRWIAVTKKVSVDIAGQLLRLGVRDLGENRPQELLRKAEALTAGLANTTTGPRWHFIGHLQRNKARHVFRVAHSIHSVDSLRLLDTIVELADRLDPEQRAPDCYLQLKLVADPDKGGLSPRELDTALDRVRGSRLPLVGLMTMAPLIDGAEEPERLAAATGTFRELASIAAQLSPIDFGGHAPRLSMGMSADLEAALAAGATDLRIGRALYHNLETDRRIPTNG